MEYNPGSKKTILIGVPSGSGTMPTSMVQSLLQLHKPYPCAFLAVERQRMDKARNIMAMEALTKGFDYLFMVDDDNPIPPDTLERFVEDDKDIVIPPILSRNPNKNGVYPLCAFYQEVVDVAGQKMRFYHPIEKFRDLGPLHQIDGGGTGAMLIKRQVLEALYKKYKDDIFQFGEIRFQKTNIDGVDYDRRTMSEDMEFCERAIDAGFEIWLDERIRPIHISGHKYVQWSK